MSARGGDSLRASPCGACGQLNPADLDACQACGGALSEPRRAFSASAFRATFVGRQREIKTLREKLEEARAGHGGVFLLAGEPGIGKTRTLREFVESVRELGLPVFSGGCIESDAGPPYGPWAQALEAYTGSPTGAAIEPALLSAQSIVSQLIPALRDRIPEGFRPARLNAQEEGARLRQAVHLLLSTLAHQQGGLVLVLEDLHWADSDSLELLSFVARGVVGSRILIVATYRDTDLALGPSRHLVKVLGELRRLPECDSTTLLGLNRAEVAQLLRGAVERELSGSLVDAIHAESDGNPFYARELCRYVVDVGGPVEARPGGRVSTDLLGIGVPDGVRQALDARLARLSLDAQRVLKTACAFGGGFTLEALHALTGLSDERLLACLDEVTAGGVLRPSEVRTRRYEFTHAIVRHAVYAGLNPDQRALIHQRVAEALTPLYGNEPRHAAEIAAQYHAAAALQGSEQGVRYALAAADQARSSHASEQSVVFLAMARDLARASVPTVRAEILCRLALAEAESLRLADAPRTAEEALTALQDVRTEVPRIAEFIVGVARALKEGGADTAAWAPLVERGLALAAAQRDLTWARLRLLQDRFEAVAGGVVSASRWLEHDPQAVAIARASGSADDYAQTLETFDWRTVQETAEVLALARTWQQPTAIMRALNVVGRDMLFFHQDFAAAAECGKELLATATRYGSISGQADALTLLASVRMVRGEWLLARQTIRRADELVQRLGAIHRLNPIVRVIIAGTFAYFLDDGDKPSLASSAARLAAEQRVGRGSILGLLLGSVAALGHAGSDEPQAARRLLEAVTPVLERMAPTMHHHNSAVQTGASAVWELDARDFAASYRRLALDLVAARVGDTPHGCNELTVARMAACLGEVAEARHWFARARQHLDATGQRPVRAMVDHDEALALLRWRSAESARCAELSGDAEQAFAALGMTTWAQRSARLRKQIQPARRSDGLTARELEVLRLLAGGRTTAEIAGQLVLSPGTVERHITHIYGKVGARGRADATAYALREGLA